jgi:DNA-directed RNA polymerase subunit RPC12/RpoP
MSNFVLLNSGYVQIESIVLFGTVVGDNGLDMKKPFICVECGKGFLTSKTYKQHVQMHSEDHDKVFKCSQCGKRFQVLALINKNAEGSFP